MSRESLSQHKTTKNKILWKQKRRFTAKHTTKRCNGWRMLAKQKKKKRSWFTDVADPIEKKIDLKMAVSKH